MHLGPFGYLRTRCKTGRTSAKVCATKSHRNFSQRTHRSIPVDPKLMCWCVLFYLGTLRTVLLHYETRCKTGRTSAKVRARSRVGIFRNECTRSTPLDPKLMFWCVLFYLGALRTVWLPYETRCKTGRTSPKVRATKLCRNFLQRTHPIHPIGP